MHKKKKKAQKKRIKKARSRKPLKKLLIDKNFMSEITTEDLKENIANILAGVTAQVGFRKSFIEGVVRKQISDTVLADALVTELNAGLDRADGKFDVAAKAESEEIDLPPSDDAGDLIVDLFAEDTLK